MRSRGAEVSLKINKIEVSVLGLQNYLTYLNETNNRLLYYYNNVSIIMSLKD